MQPVPSVSEGVTWPGMLVSCRGGREGGRDGGKEGVSVPYCEGREGRRDGGREGGTEGVLVLPTGAWVRVGGENGAKPEPEGKREGAGGEGGEEGGKEEGGEGGKEGMLLPPKFTHRFLLREPGEIEEEMLYLCLAAEGT
ncbi:hypothetical protein Naga_101260g1 [Nannochloropsis gaditana]|uniref:Uncharacterized protein n=1 Tax=Nannochloropsis gaditana TaxID=72520 RepID=W7TQE8_9STRA|nr:hypothetical protein Naga_101260g1 [Nannochloropsis gaditana]